MKNIKGFAVASDGSMKRIAITYDELDDSGKIINSNVKVNRLVVDESTLNAISNIENYVKNIIES